MRVTVRGRFSELSDQAREYLRSNQDEHDVSRAAYTAEGTLTFDSLIDFFRALRTAGDWTIASRAVPRTMGFGYRVSRRGMADVWSGARADRPQIRVMVANQPGAPSSWYLVCTRSGSRVVMTHPLAGLNAAATLPGDGVRARVETLVTEAQHVEGSPVLGHRRQTGDVLWSLVASNVWNSAAVQHRLERAAPGVPGGMRLPQRTRPRSRARRPWRGQWPAPSPPRRRPAPPVPARQRGVRSRRCRNPRRAPLRRIPLGTPPARRPAAADRYPRAQGRRGTTHPRAPRSSALAGRVPTTERVVGERS